ncbi:glycosyltransferase family 1 protein, partial [Priestia aryabhattai]|nr:glycosyltransferase family 1 protein [Priestia aryabhattai]
KYYTLGDVTEAVKEAKELMADSQLREQIRKNAFEHVKVNFNPDLYCVNFISMIQSLGLNLSK